MFYDEIAKEINSAIRDFNEKEMLIVLANLSGFRHQNRLFPDDLAMEKAVRDLTEEYKPHLRNSVDMIKDIGSLALLSHFHKVLALSNFALLKCEIEVNPVAQIPRATSTAKFQFVQCWWPGESVLWGFTSFSYFKSTNFESANTLSKYESKATLPIQVNF